MKIAILGYGTVGQGIVKILRDRKKRLEDPKTALVEPIEVGKVLVRDLHKNRGVAVEEALLTTAVSDILDDPSIDLVVEVTSDKEKSAANMLEAIRRGKHVVTANKAAVAMQYQELVRTAKANGVQFRYEASVGGGIPVLGAIEKLLPFNDILWIQGIVNGSTNYILTHLSNGEALEPVMTQAAQIGILEADPTDDVEAFDARRKIAILTDMATGAMVDEGAIPKIGIERLTDEDIAHMRGLDRKVKLVAKYERVDREGAFYARVLPTALESGVIRETDGVANIVCLQGSAVGELHFYGPGGGMEATANAILTDIYDVIYARSSETDDGEEKRVDETEVESAEYLSENTAFAEEGHYYLRGPMDTVLPYAEVVLGLTTEEAAVVSHRLSLSKCLELYEEGVVACFVENWKPGSCYVQPDRQTV